jgi:hypothetical protein
VRADPLDGGHLTALVLHGERQAGDDAPAVHEDRAGAAGALVAALLGSRQVEVLAEGVEEADPRFDLERRRDAVDDEVHGSGRRRGDGIGHGGSQLTQRRSVRWRYANATSLR